MRTLRILGLALASVLTISASVSAQGVTVTSKTRAIYLGTNGANFYDGLVQQSDVFVSLKNGVYGDLWFSTAGNTQLEFDKEIDIVLGRGGKVRDGVNYAVDGQYFFVQGIDVANVNVELSGNGQVFSPFVRFEVYAPRKSGGPRHGTMAIAGFRSNLKLGKKWAVSLEEYLKRDSGCFGFGSGLLSQGRIGLGYNLAKKTSIVTGVRLSEPLTDLKDDRVNEAVWEVGISQSF